MKYSGSLTRSLLAGITAALIMLSGCKSADVELLSSGISEISDISVTDNADRPFTAVYGAAGSAEDIPAAADVLRERLKAMYEGDFSVTAEGDHITIEFSDCASSEAEELLRDIEKTALLTFRMGWSGDIPEGGSYEELELVITGAEVAEAAAYYDALERQYGISVKLDEKGTEAFKTATRIAGENYGRISIWLDGEELLAPMVAGAIEDGSCVIAGGFSVDEAMRLAALINSGALPVDLTRTSAE